MSIFKKMASLLTDDELVQAFGEIECWRKGQSTLPEGIVRTLHAKAEAMLGEEQDLRKIEDVLLFEMAGRFVNQIREAEREALKHFPLLQSENRIIYRPHKGSIDESMQQAKEFLSEQEMKEFIVNDWNNLFDVDDIVINEESHEDRRIGWRNVRMVTTKRMGDQDNIALYGCPQAIGYCATDYK